MQPYIVPASGGGGGGNNNDREWRDVIKKKNISLIYEEGKL